MDYKNLDNTLISLLQKQSKDISKKDKIKADGNTKFYKVAFDLYKVYGDHYDGLWKLNEGYLVRASDPQYDHSKKYSNWTAVSDYENKNVTLSYKDVPIQRFSSSEFEFGEEEVGMFKSALLESVESDSEFIKNIFDSQPKNKREALYSTFPELKSIIKVV